MGKIYCSECGTELDDSVKFCSSCGTKVNNSKKEDSKTTLKTNKNEYFGLNGKNKYILLILGIVLAFILIASIASLISHEIYDHNIKTELNDTSYLDGGTYDTTINGLTFHIPNGFKETDRASDSNSEIALFEDNDQHSFKIYASTSGMLPNHGDKQGSSQKTFGGVNGEMTFYANKFNDKVANKERVTSTALCFSYQTNGQIVEIDVSHCNDEVLNILIDN